MRRSSFRSALVGAGLLAALAGAQGAGAQETDRRRRAAPAAPPPRSTCSPRRPRPTSSRTAATPSTPPSRRRPCSASPSRSRAASAAAASWSSAPPRARSPRSTAARSRRPRCGPTRSWRTATALKFNDARFSGLSAGVPGTPLTWVPRAQQVRHALARAGAAARHRASRASGFEVDQTFFNSVDAVKQYFDDVPSTAALYLDPDGTPQGRRDDDRQPGHGQDLPDHGPRGRAQGLLLGRRRRGDGRGGRRTRRSPRPPTTPGARA